MYVLNVRFIEFLLWESPGLWWWSIEDDYIFTDQLLDWRLSVINPQLSGNSTHSKVYLFCSEARHNNVSSIGLTLYEYLTEYLMESLILRYM